MTATSDLTISGISLPPCSVRGVTERLRQIDTSPARRDANGTLVRLARASHRKYVATITCTDMDSPAFGALWAGDAVTVGCVSEVTHAAALPLARAAVPGSVRHTDAAGHTLPSAVGAANVHYRPLLDMMVMSFEVQTDEYGQEVSWTLELAEV